MIGGLYLYCVGYAIIILPSCFINKIYTSPVDLMETLINDIYISTNDLKKTQYCESSSILNVLRINLTIFKIVS